jgi:peptide-methionine (S)-S-oxide reductase
MSNASATLGGGCFWCLEAVYQDVRGVTRVESGYAGGHVENPTYEQVCAGTTGHAEVVRIEYDPAAISFRELLEIFFTIHDPTTRDRQGADVGTQYRSIILYHDDDQRRIAEETIGELTRDEVFAAPIVTRVEPLTDYYPAEPYHADYYRRNPEQAYCRVVIAPKLAKFRARYAARWSG